MLKLISGMHFLNEYLQNRYFFYKLHYRYTFKNLLIDSKDVNIFKLK